TTTGHEHSHADPEYSGMGGMIMGITVTGAETPRAAWHAARRLDLVVGERKGAPRFYELSLQEAGQEARTKPRISTGLSGPAIVLNQNEPVEIAIVNKLQEATSIHWHGIELESYYDG